MFTLPEKPARIVSVEVDGVATDKFTFDNDATVTVNDLDPTKIVTVKISFEGQ